VAVAVGLGVEVGATVGTGVDVVPGVGVSSLPHAANIKTNSIKASAFDRRVIML
jgi:hypothetical protein